MEKDNKGPSEEKYVCIHGHFYQPPRENPWLEEIELQSSASPFHDWNERITSECYGPNTASRITDGEGRIREILNNYSKISFNMGPTLFSWLEQKHPEIYEQIREADRVSLRERQGHGNALSQIYSHLIMPLATRRDKVTQVKWGISDFEHRFSRKPEGMWLSETAVDRETLLVLAEEGIRFTILSPAQAHRIRPIKTDAWEDVNGGKIDPTRPYRLFLPDQKSIDLFFYDGPVSHALAFERLLASGEQFVLRLNNAFSDQRTGSQLVNIATDGESYGHHFSYGDMALAYTLHQIEAQKMARLTNYGEYLSTHPPTYEVEIFEKSSWSCAHGVERWRANCGCRIGGQADWTQEWRAPLREGLDELKADLDLFFEEQGSSHFREPWEARNRYIDLILGRQKERVEDFFSRHQRRTLSAEERRNSVELLEMQRHALLMFTSCGWFFDDISGIETQQVLKYASRALQLAQQVERPLNRRSAVDWEERLIKRLSMAKSNLPEFKDGAEIYAKWVKPFQVSLKQIISYFVIGSIFSEGRPDQEKAFYCYDLKLGDYQKIHLGQATLSLGEMSARSRVTGEECDAVFGALHLGAQDLYCVMRERFGPEEDDSAKTELFNRFSRGSLADMVRELDRQFGGPGYGLSDLPLEVRQRVLKEIIRRVYPFYDEVQRQFYTEQQRLMEVLIEAKVGLPREFLLAVEHVLNRDLSQVVERLASEDAQKRLVEVVQEAKRWGVNLETDRARSRLKGLLEEQIKFIRSSEDEEVVKGAHRILDLAQQLQLPLDLWWSQNLFVRVKESIKEPSANVKRLGFRLCFLMEEP